MRDKQSGWGSEGPSLRWTRRSGDQTLRIARHTTNLCLQQFQLIMYLETSKAPGFTCYANLGQMVRPKVGSKKNSVKRPTRLLQTSIYSN